MISVLKWLGSVWFTALISVVLIFLLVVTTFLESRFGTPFAQKNFYQTFWFDVVVSLLWVNIFCSTVLRFPFKRGHAGFLVTHVGIMLLLAGALVARHTSFEGQVALFEGEATSRARIEGEDLAVIFPNREEVRFPLRPGTYFSYMDYGRMNAQVPFCPLKDKPKASGVLPPGAEAFSVRLERIIEHAAQKLEVTEGEKTSPPNRAVRLSIKSAQMGVMTDIWLIEREAGNPLSREAVLGPLSFKLSPLPGVETMRPVLRVLDREGNDIAGYSFDGSPVPPEIPLGTTGYFLRALEFFPFATVGEENRLVNAPQAGRSNPAVAFELVSPDGKSQRVIRFALFPDFESMHAGSMPEHEFKFIFDAPDGGFGHQDGPRVDVYYSDEGVWSYRSVVGGRDPLTGPVKEGQCVPAGWMGAEICFDRLLTRARSTYEIIPDPEKRGPLAAGIIVPGSAETFWAFENQETPVPLPKGTVSVAVLARIADMPFTVSLKDFRKKDYPGTRAAASYESDVILADEQEGVTLERTISMNRPLGYKGFKVFQTSFMEDTGSGEGSVFTVARNPGISLVYAGAVFGFLGALVQFYGKKEN